jgi:hypothetical protein
MKLAESTVSAASVRAELPASAPAAETAANTPSKLGEPLDIKRAAAIIGCSPWTVRQTLIPQGLPFFRTGASGKLIFYREQIVRWIERRQRLEGGVT